MEKNLSNYVTREYAKLDSKEDEARKEVVETIPFKLQYHRDSERAEQVKNIKGW